MTGAIFYKFMRYFILNKLPGIFLATFLMFFLFPPLNIIADQPIVVVLDPGHGGDNKGALHNGYIEKEMNLIVAKAMKEELEKYEGIVVYLTREDDTIDMNLKERAKFAENKKADFMFSLHFNMSATHMLYGAEVWISAFDDFYAKGHSFGQIQMAAYDDLGLFNRGIKTRLNNSGDDYYGIIRESRKLGINTVLIEHCHLDHVIDEEFYALGDFQLEEFGKLTAASVAKYYQLKSSLLDIDYSDYPVPAVPVPTEVMKQDLSPPDVCYIELMMVNEEAKEAVINLTAEDYDSRILYYGISLDGGISFDTLRPFPAGETELTVTVNLPTGTEISILAAAYNAYDRITQSNIILIDPLTEAEILAEIEEDEEELLDVTEVSLKEFTQELVEMQEQIEKKLNEYHFIIIGIVILMLILIAVIISRVDLLRRLMKS